MIDYVDWLMTYDCCTIDDWWRTLIDDIGWWWLTVVDACLRMTYDDGCWRRVWRMIIMKIGDDGLWWLHMMVIDGYWLVIDDDVALWRWLMTTDDDDNDDWWADDIGGDFWLVIDECLLMLHDWWLVIVDDDWWWLWWSEMTNDIMLMRNDGNSDRWY